MERFAACFAELEDPREDKRHALNEILMIALCAVLCGAEDCSDMALFGRAKEAFLRQFLELHHGMPSHDTFSRVFRLLDPAQFQLCFLRFMDDFAAAAQEVITIDGKTLRRSFDRASGKSPLHLVSAWASGARLVLGQVATDEKSNEITAVPKLLEMLSLKGAIVTADALNCQRAIATQVVAQGGDYVLALKENQGTLQADVSLYSTIRLMLRRWRAAIRRWRAITDASRHDEHSSAATSHGCRNTINGQVSRLSAKSCAAARSMAWPSARPPIICSADRFHPLASPRWRAPIGESKIASIGCWTSP
jgi:predicted transposase YbfD/YdcC